MNFRILNPFFQLLLAVSVSFTSIGSAYSAELCENNFHNQAAEQAAEKVKVAPEINVRDLTQHPASIELGQELIQFAHRHNFPIKVIEVGPEARRVKRIMVALDVTNQAAVDDYLKTFNLQHAIGKEAAGTIAIEFQKESPGQYVYGVTRTKDGKVPNANGVWRFGRENAGSATWWANQYFKTDANGKVLPSAFGHLIGVTKAEVDNLNYYFDHPEERGPCKSDNCVSWMTGIELGKTSKDGTDETRLPLFNVLGVSRTIAHFEIARRLMHAANTRHIGVVAFVRGAEGLEVFKTRDDLLPDEPKIPYTSIIPNLPFGENSSVMKAVAQIPDGAKVFIPIAAGASPDGVTALIQQSIKMQKGYDLHMLVNGISESALQRGIETTDGKFRVHALFLGGNMRKLNREGKVELRPGYLSDFTRWSRDPDQPDFHYDAIIVRVAPADANGHYSLGPNNDMIMTIIRNRPGIKVIAEVNENIPRTVGENFLTKDQITAFFESRTELAGPPVVPLTVVEVKIGNNLGKLVSSEAYLQVGIGNIFGGFASGLQANRRDHIKIFSEMFGDAQMEMIQTGIADSAEVGFAFGSAAMYAGINNNPKIKFVETEYVNNPGRVAALAKFHAVNTALQVNLRGDVNATHGPDGKRISSPGGQVEFMSAAARSEGGKAIIAIRSTAKQGEVSAIVLDNYAGSVTTPHESVTHVVTEYGIAQMRGATESERAVRLISIAHPKFRPQLIEQARAKNMITEKQAQSIPLQ